MPLSSRRADFGVVSRALGRHVEDKHFRGVVRDQAQTIEFGSRRTVTCLQNLAIERYGAASDLHPGHTPVAKREFRAFSTGKAPGIEIDIAVDRHRTVASIAGADEPKTASELFGSERLLLVTRLKAVTFRQDPDLQKMHIILRRRIELRMPDACAR